MSLREPKTLRTSVASKMVEIREEVSVVGVVASTPTQEYRFRIWTMMTLKSMLTRMVSI